jgi:GNAT superfamily N-acetyltransferase
MEVIKLNIKIREITEELFMNTVKMLTELMNYHRKLTNAPKEFWQTEEESIETLREWEGTGKIYNIFCNETLAGFFYVRFGGQNAAWLEDLFISEEFRGEGIGKLAMNKLDEMLKEQGVLAMFVDVIPRNSQAIKFYIDCGFDHLNMIQLRKNYDSKLNKDEDIEILGFKLKKY